MMYETDDEYREQLLKYFQLDEYQSEVIIKKIERLQEKIKDIPEITKMAFDAGDRINSTDMDICIMLLFSFDHFYEFSKLLEKHKITVE